MHGGGRIPLAHCPFANPAELVDDDVGRENGATAEHGVSRQCRAVDQDGVVLDNGIMASVGRHHPVCPVTDDGGLPLTGPTRDRDSFAKNIVIADAEVADRAGVELEILRVPAQDGVAVYDIILAEVRILAKGSMLAHNASMSDHNIGLNDTVRSDLDVIGENSTWVYNCGGMDFGHWL